MLHYIFQYAQIAINNAFFVIAKIQMKERIFGQCMLGCVVFYYLFVYVIPSVFYIQVIIYQFPTSEISTSQINYIFHILINNELFKKRNICVFIVVNITSSATAALVFGCIIIAPKFGFIHICENIFHHVIYLIIINE